jgi:hypothetical protein
MLHSIRGFVVIDSMHSIAVIEQGDRMLSPVSDNAMKPSIQSGWERGIFFGQMNEITWPL